MHEERTPAEPAVTLQVALAGAGLVLQTWLVEYDASSGPAISAFWLAVGVFLLWLVHQRRSQVARWLLVVAGGLGTVLYATSTIAGALPLLTGLGLVAGFGIQAVAMLRGSVVEHCRTG